MYAALTAADETVTFLLSKGADPDLMAGDNGNTALECAISSQCSSTIALLAPVTKKRLGDALANMALQKTELTPAVEHLLKRTCRLDEVAAEVGLVNAVHYGATKMLKILTSIPS